MFRLGLKYQQIHSGLTNDPCTYTNPIRFTFEIPMGFLQLNMFQLERRTTTECVFYKF